MKKDVYLGNGCFGSGKTLKHYKYISRKKVGDKWVYEYADEAGRQPNRAAERAKMSNKSAKSSKTPTTKSKPNIVDTANEKSTPMGGDISRWVGNIGDKVTYDLYRAQSRRRKEALDERARNDNRQTPDRAAEQVKLAAKRAAAKQAQADKLKSASKMSTSGMTNIDKSTAKVEERARNDNRQMPDRAAEQVKLAEKRTAAKQAKVANIKSASKMNTTITDDSNIRSAKKPASTPVGKVSDEYKKNLEFNSQKNDYKLTIHPNGAPSSKKETPKPVGNVSDEYKKNLEYNSQKNDYGNGKRKSALSENNKQNRLLKNLKKAIANSRKKKKVQKK